MSRELSPLLRLYLTKNLVKMQAPALKHQILWMPEVPLHLECRRTIAVNRSQ